MTPVALDASLAVQWFTKEPGAEAATPLFGGGHQLIAPDLLLPEVAPTPCGRSSSGTT